MKTSTMVIIGVAAFGAYLAYKSSTSSKKMTGVLSYGGVPRSFPVDANMTDAEIASVVQQWNTAGQTSNQQAMLDLIGQVSAANHPMAAAELTRIYNEAASHQGATGYSAGALNPIGRVRQIPHPLVPVHRLAMVGRI